MLTTIPPEREGYIVIGLTLWATCNVKIRHFIVRT